MKKKLTAFLVGCTSVALVSNPPSALACAVCFGKSDSALAQGLQWGVFSLLGIVLCVLGGIAGFFVYLARRAAAVNETASVSAPEPAAVTTQKV